MSWASVAIIAATTNIAKAIVLPTHATDTRIKLRNAQTATNSVIRVESEQPWQTSAGRRLHSLGNGAGSSVPVAVAGISNAVAIATGYGFGCASLSTGSIQRWGDNSAGQLGNGVSGISLVPVTVSGF